MLNSINSTDKCIRIKLVHALHQNLESQQATFAWPLDSDKFIQLSCAMSPLIAQKLRPHVEGEFVKECMVATAELLYSGIEIKMVAEY